MKKVLILTAVAIFSSSVFAKGLHERKAIYANTLVVERFRALKVLLPQLDPNVDIRLACFYEIFLDWHSEFLLSLKQQNIPEEMFYRVFDNIIKTETLVKSEYNAIQTMRPEIRTAIHNFLQNKRDANAWALSAKMAGVNFAYIAENDFVKNLDQCRTNSDLVASIDKEAPADLDGSDFTVLHINPDTLKVSWEVEPSTFRKVVPHVVYDQGASTHEVKTYHKTKWGQFILTNKFLRS